MAIINGTAGNDPFGTLNGTNNNDTINGFGGNDTLFGRGGADILNGGDGNDIFFYEFAGDIGDGVGKDAINGGVGFDTVQVLEGVDFQGAAISSIEALTFTDTTMTDFRFVNVSASQIGNGFAGTLKVTGDAGDDIVQVNMGSINALSLSKWTFANWTNGASVFLGDRVQINGDASNERIVGSSRNDYIESDAGNDQLYGFTGADTINAGEGADLIAGDGGIDTLTGGAGKDTFLFRTVGGAANRDTISDFSVVDDTIGLSKAIFSALGPVGHAHSRRVQGCRRGRCARCHGPGHLQQGYWRFVL